MNVKFKKSIYSVVFMFLLLTVFGTRSYANDPSTTPAFDGQKGSQWEEKISKIYEQIGVTPEQEQQLKALREKHRFQRTMLWKEIKLKRQQIQTEFQKDNFDVNKVKQIHGELKALKNQMEDHRLEGILEVRNLLTPEQFKRFIELKEDFKKKHWSHKGNWSDKDTAE